MKRSPIILAGTASCLGGVLTACQSPLEQRSTDALRSSVLESIRADLADASEPVRMERVPSDLDFSEERIEQLDEMSGVTSYRGETLPLGPDLIGAEEFEETDITLAAAIQSAISNNLRTQAARLEPAIRVENAVVADAIFDWTLYASADYARNKNPTPLPVVGGIPVGVGVTRNESSTFVGGVNKQTRYGGFIDISTTADIFNNRSEGFTTTPDPARSADLDLVISQPLLEGFGYDVNMARVYLAQNNTEAGVELLRRNLIDTITDVENAYWELYLSRQEILIRARLLERGIQTRDAVRGRLGFDVKQAQVADAVAQVEARRADLTRARNRVRIASDRLKALLNDPQYPLDAETILLPADSPLDEPIQFSLLEAITSGVVNRPEVRISEIRIQDADIRRLVAENATLPFLTLDARVNVTGLDDDMGDAYGNLFSDDFYDTAVGLAFEQPIGNRGPEADLRRARLERVQAVTVYRASIEDTILDVKTALRDLATNFQLLEQTRTTRLAAAENLRTLQAEEETIRSLTPEFLDLKLRRQDSLALAEFQEVQARTDYSSALAELYRAMGVTLERNGVVVNEPTPGESSDAYIERDD